jgi:Ca-activated chloride channel family protein
MNEAMASMEVRGGIPPILQSAHLNGRISGLVAYMRVEHCYRNASNRELEVTYTFPMPPAAVLTAVELEIGGEKHKGVVKPKNQASQDYDAAVEDGDTPVIIDRVGPGLFSATLGNLKPGDEATIRYNWVMPIRVQSGVARVSIPTCVKERFGNPLAERLITPHQVPQQNALVEYPFTVEITFDQEMAAARISCPQHDSAVVEWLSSPTSDAKRLIIRDDAFLDRNLTILLEQLPDITASTQIAVDKEIFLHATLPSPIAEERNHVSVKLLIDCSGSMQSENALKHAKRAAQTLIKMLDQSDYASLSSFGSEVFHSSDELKAVSKQVHQFLSKEIGKLSANLGGTELEMALVETIRKIAVPETAPPACILLITDGASWSHRRIIRAATKAGVKIFCIGVGDNPAESLLHELAVYTDADYVLLSQGESLEQAINQMLARMRLSGSLRVNLEWPGQDLQWVYPNANTPIYASEQLHFFARTRKVLLPEGIQQSSPLLRFTASAQGTAAESAKPLTLTEADNSDLVKLIANAEMMASSEAAALDIALRHQLISEQTSLIAIHERKLADKAIGAPTAVTVDHMNAGFAPVAEPILFSGPHFSREEPYAARSESLALWREASTEEPRENVMGPLFESIEIPEFLRKNVDERPRDHLRDLPRDRPVPRLISDQYSTPQEILSEVSLIDTSRHNFEAALGEFFLSVRLPKAYRVLLDEAIASQGTFAIGIFVLILSGEMLEHQRSLSPSAERRLEEGLRQCSDPDYLSDLAARLRRLLKGVTPLDWPI